MRSIVWWTVWGLVLAIGAIGLMEFPRNHFFLILSIPLLTGAVAAAIRRLEHEYKHAVEHAKWAGVSALFLLSALGFLYLKAHAFGPFSSATHHKALLGTTFGMSVPEVERKIGRKLRDSAIESALQERAQAWLVDALPLPASKSDESFSVLASLYGTRGEVTFHFDRRKLNRVELQFMPSTRVTAIELKDKIVAELVKEYHIDEETTRDGVTYVRFHKDAVEATMRMSPSTGRLMNLRIALEYLPLAEKSQSPLTVDSNVF